MLYSKWGENSLNPIGGLHCCHVGVQNKRKFVHVVCIKVKVPQEKNLIVPVHQHGRQIVTCTPSIFRKSAKERKLNFHLLFTCTAPTLGSITTPLGSGLLPKKRHLPICLVYTTTKCIHLDNGPLVVLAIFSWFSSASNQVDQWNLSPVT